MKIDPSRVVDAYKKSGIRPVKTLILGGACVGAKIQAGCALGAIYASEINAKRVHEDQYSAITEHLGVSVGFRDGFALGFDGGYIDNPDPDEFKEGHSNGLAVRNEVIKEFGKIENSA